MTEKNKINNPQSTTRQSQNVSDFMLRLEHPMRPEIEALRQTILGANDQIKEEVKWNAPSFYIKEHFATLNLHRSEFVQVIFHRGARVKDIPTEEPHIEDPNNLLVWITKDRCAARFFTMNDITSKSSALADIVNQWIQKM